MLYQIHARTQRRGLVTVIVVLAIIGLVGIVAIALDGGLLQDNRRRLQNATDAAALAAANSLYSNYPHITVSTPDPSNAAATAAKQSASDNGFPNNGTSSTVVVNIPPTSGPFTGLLAYAEVIVTYYQPRYFSSIFGTTKLPVVARAVSKGYWGGSGKGVIVLDPTVKSSLIASGGGSATVTGGASMVVDSNNADAATVSGGGSLTAKTFEVTGGTIGPFNGTVNTGVSPTPDPLAYLPVPPVPPDGTMTVSNIPGKGGGKQYVLTPGRYTNLPNFTSGDQVILQQASANSVGGIFYLDGTSFISNGANISMEPSQSGGVMIYNNPANGANSQGVSIQGNSGGSIVLSALTSGPYAGILMWQNRTATQALSVSGNGTINLSGTFYAANALLNMGGNGTATIGSQFISRTLNISGGGTQTINYTDAGTARIRQVCLVE